MRSIDKAVILAAGLGNRISAVAHDIPKPLLPLDGRGLIGANAGEKPAPGDSDTFLDWHLRALSAAGVKEIYIVGNRVTCGTQLRAMREVPATWILNPTEDLSTSGSGHSTWFAWNSEHGILDGKSRVVLMDADILYDPRLFKDLASAPGDRSKTLVCGEFRETNEEVLVFSDPRQADVPRYHGKGLLGTPLVEGSRCLGEATGILLWEPGDHAALRAVTDWTIRYSTAKTRSEHEDITQRMMLLDRMQGGLLRPRARVHGVRHTGGVPGARPGNVSTAPWLGRAPPSRGPSVIRLRPAES
jgi:choline kinase